jgi:hypothetical protein
VKRALLFAALFVVAAGAYPALAQCTMCKTALTGSSEGQRIANEFNHAILMMVAAPYLIFGTIAAWLFRTRIVEWLGARLPLHSRSL